MPTSCDDLRPVAAGDALNISAGTWNELLRTARSSRLNRLGKLDGEAGTDGVAPSVTVLIQNTTGATITPYPILAITGTAVDPTPQPLEFRARPLFTGYTPAHVDDAIAIVNGPIGESECGQAVLQGIAVCTVTINDSADQWAAPIAGNNLKLASSSDAGPARILWKAGGAGDQLCVVCLMQGAVAHAITFVQITSTTPTGKLYPAQVVVYDPVADTLTVGAACWYIDAMGTAPILNSYHMAAHLVGQVSGQDVYSDSVQCLVLFVQVTDVSGSAGPWPAIEVLLDPTTGIVAATGDECLYYDANAGTPDTTGTPTLNSLHLALQVGLDSGVKVYADALNPTAGQITVDDDKTPNVFDEVDDVKFIYATATQTRGAHTADITPDDCSQIAPGIVNIITTGTTGTAHGGQVLGDGDKLFSQNVLAVTSSAGSDTDSTLNHAGFTASILKFPPAGSMTNTLVSNTVALKSTPVGDAAGSQVFLKVVNIAAADGDYLNSNYAYTRTREHSIDLAPIAVGQNGPFININSETYDSGGGATGTKASFQTYPSAASGQLPGLVTSMVGTDPSLVENGISTTLGNFSFSLGWDQWNTGSTGTEFLPVYGCIGDWGIHDTIWQGATVTGGIVTGKGNACFTGDETVVVAVTLDPGTMLLTVTRDILSFTNGWLVEVDPA